MLDDATLRNFPRERQVFRPYIVTDKVAISVVGLGYVGAVSVGCLSGLGHQIVGVDVDPSKLDCIQNGKSPMEEKGLNTLLAQGVARGVIDTTNEISVAIERTDVTLVSVGTPTSPDGGCDLRYIESVADEIGRSLAGKSEFHVIVLRSSVPPGTTEGVVARRIERLSGKVMGRDFGIGFAPEFLREGVAVDDFKNPPKTVIGASDDRTASIVAKIFDPVDPNPLMAPIEVAELVKYVDNVWHATKVSFANEVGRLSKALDIDGRHVMDIFCKDTKLNLSPYYLKPGFAYGGSCLPKEVRAVAHLAETHDISLPVVQSLAESNAEQIETALRLLGNSGARRVGILGVAFKAGTNDLRESPTLEVMKELSENGVDVKIHDACLSPQNLSESIGHAVAGKPRLEELAAEMPGMLVADAERLLDEVDAILVTHNTANYRHLLRNWGKPIVDAVGLFSPAERSANIDGLGW